MFLYKPTTPDDDIFLIWPNILSTEVIINLGIASACVPYLKPFLTSINSGMIGSEDIRRRGSSYTLQKYASKTKAFSKKKISTLLSSRTDTTRLESQIEEEEHPANWRPIALALSRSNVVVTADGDALSVASQSSKANCIKQTQTFAIGSEHGDRSP